MPLEHFAGGVPLLYVRDRPEGPTSGRGLTFYAEAGHANLDAREVEDLRDALSDWLKPLGR